MTIFFIDVGRVVDAYRIEKLDIKNISAHYIDNYRKL